MVIQKAYGDKEPQVSRYVEVTPAMLRAMADRLELKRKFAMPGDIITLQIANGIAVIWDPEVPVMTYLDRIEVPELA